MTEKIKQAMRKLKELPSAAPTEMFMAPDVAARLYELKGDHEAAEAVRQCVRDGLRGPVCFSADRGVYFMDDPEVTGP